MSSLRESNIFRLNPLISNFNCKLSTITEYDPKKQLLCLVSEDNEILLRYSSEAGVVALKLVSWFNKCSRVIHDVCFDPSGCWLLVLCFDNTLHIVPALKILDDTQLVPSNTFSTSEITSFVIPFVGPHECPCSKSCPNNDFSTTPSSSPIRWADYILEQPASSKDSQDEHSEIIQISNEHVDTQNVPNLAMDKSHGATSTETSSRKSSKNYAESTLSRTNETNTTSRIGSESFLTSSTCPYPISAAWWQTLDKRNRAVIGYSDGSICFVGLSPNCPFIANTSIENGGVSKLFVCRDNSMENVTLLINSTSKQQWKLLLEQKCISYTFPGDISPTSSQTNDSSHEEWQFVLPVKPLEMNESGKVPIDGMKTEEPSSNAPSETLPPNGSVDQKSQDNEETSGIKGGLLPAAKARLALLKNLGTKKFNALKMKLSEQKLKMEEYLSEGQLGSFAIVDSPTTSPEILTTPAGPYFVVQNLRNTYLLSALHTYSDTLSVHSMDISLIPLFLYKIPKQCQEVLIGSNLLYAIQVHSENKNSKNLEELKVNNNENDEHMESKEILDNNAPKEEKLINAVSVISSAMASMKNGEEKEFNEKALLGTFLFTDETVINVYRMATYSTPEKPIPKEESNDTLQSGIRSPSSYIRLQKKNINETYNLSDVEFMQNEFPEIKYDPCIVVTNKNTYFIDLHSTPYEIFLNAALSNSWATCEEFTTTFDLHFQQCIEFAGDYLLRKKKVTQALLTYNVARIPPVRTALKLAMFGENYALMHLCAMALKCVHIIKSNHLSKPIINALFHGGQFRQTESILNLMPKKPSPNEVVNEGKSCSDFTYGTDETSSSLQMAASSQFHLSNLLLITLAERAVKEKNYIPLWNFLVTNTKFHTNMTSIVLCQSGLYSAAILLALVRGACIDVLVGLVSVATQEFGWYSELNVLLYNLSDAIFAECLTYLRHISTDYFSIIQDKLEKLETNVLERLEKQLNPFSSVFRPIVFNLSLKCFDSNEEESTIEFSNFCRMFIETYLGIILQLEAHKKKPENLLNALSTFQLNHEDNQFAIDSGNFSPISVGCSHSACVIDGCAYFWGSNGVPFVYSVTKTSDPPEPPHVVKSLDIISQLNLEVHAVKCGRQHSLVLTNNGLYAFGSNQLGQLGINARMLCALQPVLVEAFDNKNITILEAGQYHNAAVAEDILYTWGWGAYGQLGHGDIENCQQPKVVSFFNGKKIMQVSLGHAHSLVLCCMQNGSTELYVFGSNHFGQLGIWQSSQEQSKEINQINLVKSLVPLKLEFSEDPIRLIHTKFFSNLAVSTSNKLYTWGSSPQALRLANQIKRRATAKQKIEENLRKEINKRIESNKEVEENVKKDLIPKNKNCSKKNKSDDIKIEDKNLRNESQTTLETNSSSEVDEQEIEIETGVIDLDKVEPEILDVPTIKIEDVAEEIIVPTVEAQESRPVSNLITFTGTTTKRHHKKPDVVETESIDHFYPLLVDTSEVSGQIIQMSSGLFHFALISSTSLLYTWGKNLEHQLGTEDKERKAVSKPTPLESIENPLHVECGADFTIVITTDYIVKAFGGNTNGQCARDLGPSVDKNKSGKFFALPTTKRLMRLEGQCVETPVDVNLPRPRIRMDLEPTRYLKSVPKFRPQLVQKCGLSLDIDTVRSLSSGGNAQDYHPESDDITSSVENVSFIEEDSITSSVVRVRHLSSDLTPEEDSKEIPSDPVNLNDFRLFVHYCLYIFHGLYDSDKISDFTKHSTEFRIRILMLNFKFVEAFKICLTECLTAQKSIKVFEFFTKDTSIIPMRKQDLKFFIYELFIHFLSQKFDLVECEKFFLTDLDYYLLELSYVLFFNNNNTEMEQQLNKKFKNLFLQDISESQDHKLEDTDRIFDNLSVKFKSIVCQRLLQVSEN